MHSLYGIASLNFFFSKEKNVNMNDSEKLLCYIPIKNHHLDINCVQQLL